MAATRAETIKLSPSPFPAASRVDSRALANPPLASQVRHLGIRFLGGQPPWAGDVLAVAGVGDLGAAALGMSCSNNHGHDFGPILPLVHRLFGLVSVPVVSYNGRLKPLRPAMPPFVPYGQRSRTLPGER